MTENERKNNNDNNSGKSGSALGKISTSREGADPRSFYKGFDEHLRYSLAVDRESAGQYDMYNALVLTIRDRLIDRWVKTKKEQDEAASSSFTICLLSILWEEQ